MLKKCYVLFFVFLYSIKSLKFITLSELNLPSHYETLSEKEKLKLLEIFIQDNTTTKKKGVKEIIYDYIDNCCLENEKFLKEKSVNEISNKKLDILISKLFLFSSKLLLKSNYILNLNDINLKNDFQYLSNLLDLILGCENSSEYYCLNNLIINVIKKKGQLMHLFLKKNKTQNDKFNFNTLFKSFLDDTFNYAKYYFNIYFRETIPFLFLEKEFSLNENLHFLGIDINNNVDTDIFKKYADCFCKLSDSLIFLELYVKQIKYFLNNLIFLSLLKKNSMDLSEVNEIFYNKSFYENLQKFFNSSCFGFCAVGQYIECFNLDEFLGIKKMANFFNYKNDLNVSDVEIFSVFFLKLVESYEKDVSILNFDEFDIDSFINYIVKTNGKIKYPIEILNILNFVFLYDSYRSILNLNEENFLYNDEKKGNFKIEKNSESTNELNSNDFYKFDFLAKQHQNSCKSVKKTPKSLNFEHNLFFRFENIYFDFLNKKIFLGIGYRVNKESFFLGLSLFFDFNFFSFSIAYFLKNMVVFSGFIKFYKFFFICFSLSSNKKTSLGISCFLDSKDVCLDINFNFYF